MAIDDHGSAHDRRGELLDEARERAARRRPADLLAQWRDDSTVEPSPLDLRTALAFDALALEAAPGYDALLLSPVAPLGAASVVAPTSQDRTLSTIRPSEVVSDPTNVLALEAARRLREAPLGAVRLCTVHQVLRMQAAPPGRGRTRHFRMFALADAGRARPEDAFEVEAVVAHLAVYRRQLELAAERHGVRFAAPRATVSSDEARRVLGDRTVAAIAEAFPDVEVVREPIEAAYYDGFRVQYGVHARDGAFLSPVDLGRFDWVASLTSDRRNRYVASAIGIQLLPLLLGGEAAGGGIDGTDPA
ncbi:hypothetical protein EDM22_00880 [Agromyces tardus]|jgi:hypothetical protein|uniref:Uncharacterized protein n=1 Tax=Agromyces tardus TaxID=2583849 RepID=A0A3M8AP57_9MICO|nr:hypothetical protein [Agromyces tardus]RNB52295.1 hypothetical protein EDM22_00880 [Agromyces tardus]